MINYDLKKLSSIKNFEIKKSTVGSNRTWKKETIEAFKKIARNKRKKNAHNDK
jgi:hypothetical protein|tara:strand:+ start:344 stop:502 length:159 start_codon:yes stop_codon:yes gene_type:complete